MNITSRIKYDIMPDDIRKAISEYLIKYYNINIPEESITTMGGEKISEVFQAYEHKHIEPKEIIK